MNEQELEAQNAALKKALAEAHLTQRIGKVAGVAPSAIGDVVGRALERFDVDDKGALRVKPLSGAVSWETPETFVDSLRLSAPHLFDGNATKPSAAAAPDLSKMSVEQKLAYANERTRPVGMK